MASINTIVKRKQYLWLGIVVAGTRMSRSQQTREPVRPTPTIQPVPWCHTSAPFTPKKVPVCMNMPPTPASQKHPGK